MSKIKEGITTKAEVRELLGRPDSITMKPDGSETRTYTSDDIVMISFNPQGIVTSIDYKR